MQSIHTLMRLQFHHLAIATVLAGAIAVTTMWPRAGSSEPVETRCESWDQAASTALAGLIGDRSEAADAKLGDALFRLRRARKHCRHGFVSLAKLDYDALLSSRYRIGQ